MQLPRSPDPPAAHRGTMVSQWPSCQDGVQWWGTVVRQPGHGHALQPVTPAQCAEVAKLHEDLLHEQLRVDELRQLYPGAAPMHEVQDLSRCYAKLVREQAKADQIREFSSSTADTPPSQQHHILCTQLRDELERADHLRHHLWSKDVAPPEDDDRFVPIRRPPPPGWRPGPLRRLPSPENDVPVHSLLETHPGMSHIRVAGDFREEPPARSVRQVPLSFPNAAYAQLNMNGPHG